MYIVREPPKNLQNVPSSRLAICVAVSFATGGDRGSGIPKILCTPLDGMDDLSTSLGGGFKDFLFSTLLGEIIHFD